jgi:phage terminase small subunit
VTDVKYPQFISPAQVPESLRAEFIDRYLIDLDATKAAADIGLLPIVGRRLLAVKAVSQAIAYARRQRMTRTRVYADEVLRCWEEARVVDYNEFTSVVIGCCRYCWGINHRFQFTSFREMEELAREHRRKYEGAQDKADFDNEGGEGYDKYREPMRGPDWAARGYPPNSDHSCPECNGGGSKPLVIFRDTTKMSRGAKYIFQGVEVTPNGGIKYVLTPRREFDDMVAKHLGMFARDKPPSRDPADMSDDELETILRSNGVTVEVEWQTIDNVQPGEDGGSLPALVDRTSEEADSGEDSE